MKYLTLSLLALFAAIGCAKLSKKETTSQLPPSYSESPSWLLGFNTPWNDFGHDFGGRAENKAFWEKAFDDAADMGLNAMRVWIHCDGRGSPIWDLETDTPIAFPENFERDFGEMLDMAAEHGIAVMPCFWSFDLVVNRVDEHGPSAGVHKRFVQTPSLIKAYTDNLLTPLVLRFDSHPALYAWEICNEPEWIAENHDIPEDDVIRFVGLQAAAIQRIAEKPVTNGSAGIKWHANPPIGKRNWWDDETMIQVSGDSDATLDFYQIHSYGWMLPAKHDPYAITADMLNLGKPVMIGETGAIGMVPPKDSGLATITAEDTILIAKKNGYFGHYFWSFSGHDGEGGRPEIREAVKKAATIDPTILPSKAPGR